MGMVAAGTSRQKVRLSWSVIEYANAVAAGDEQAEKELIAECSAKALKLAIRFCELQSPNFVKLFLQLKFLAGIPDAWEEHRDTAESNRMSIGTAIEIMAFAGVVDRRYMPKNAAGTWRAGFRISKTTR